MRWFEKLPIRSKVMVAFVGGITKANNSTGAVANQLLASARALTGQPSEMRNRVGSLLTQVKAA